jgi:hypothetical protein
MWNRAFFRCAKFNGLLYTGPNVIVAMESGRGDLPSRHFGVDGDILPAAQLPLARRVEMLRHVPFTPFYRQRGFGKPGHAAGFVFGEIILLCL